MIISIDFNSYLEHKQYFDEMAICMQSSMHHKVGILTGMREDKQEEIASKLGFSPSFIILWGIDEAIGSGSLWKVQKLVDMKIDVHFDEDATELKKLTDKWIIKVMNSNQKEKF